MSTRTNEQTIIYGIKNCDTVKKALNYLNSKKVDFEFHDYKKLGIEASKIKGWAKTTPFEKLINKNGPTYRKLSDADKIKLEKLTTAIPVMQENTSVIKRPILEFNGQLVVGFDEKIYDTCKF